MKVYVSADIEGVTGIAHWDEASHDKAAYAPFRDRMAAETRAACEGALQAGAREVWVKDAHATGRNLRPDDLPLGTRLIRGWSGHPWRMVQELDESFDALVFVGYHSPAGSGANPLAHTMTGRYAAVLLNGEPLSELHMHALIGRTLGVPAVFLAGDAALCKEAERIEPGIVTVPTGRGVGHSVISEDPTTVLEAIRDGVARAVSTGREVPPLPDRFVVDLRYRRAADAYKARFYPGMTHTADDAVRLVATDWREVVTALLFV